MPYLLETCFTLGNKWSVISLRTNLFDFHQQGVCKFLRLFSQDILPHNKLIPYQSQFLLALFLELLQLLLLLLALDEVRLVLRLFLTAAWASLLCVSDFKFFLARLDIREFFPEHLLFAFDLRNFDLFFLTCKDSSRVYVYKISSSSSAALFSSSFFKACRWPSSQSFFAISTSSCQLQVWTKRIHNNLLFLNNTPSCNHFVPVATRTILGTKFVVSGVSFKVCYCWFAVTYKTFNCHLFSLWAGSHFWVSPAHFWTQPPITPSTSTSTNEKSYWNPGVEVPNFVPVFGSHIIAS